MSVHNHHPAHTYGRTGLITLLGILVSLAGWILLGGNRSNGEPPLGPRAGGDARLVSIEPFSDDGEMCQWTPASANGSLFAELSRQQEDSEPAASRGSAEPRPTDAARTDASKRPPVRVMRDPSAAFSGVAVDLVNNEVVLTDENNFAIMTYDRLENTPPRARMSEPKRMIQGMEAYLEFNCSVYVDPVNGDIYSVNNDTLNWLTVFSREVKGNMPPTRKLRAPHTVFGIAVDEEKQEILLSDQDDHAVVAFKKNAKEQDSPIRVLQGKRTLLADPHGIAIDPKTGLVFVTNWGTNSERPPLGDASVKPTRIGGVARSLWPVDRNHTIPSSGRIVPPSITIYPKGAEGDTAPLRVIEGPKTQMNWPTAIAIDSGHGELFVANDTGDSVTVYRSDATGDAAPIRVLKGPHTMVKNPTGVAYDAKHDELWVANFGSHAATVFKRTAAGDAAPLRVIRSAPPDAPSPMIGNPHTITYDTKREEILVSN
jgi:DNA-binding beta-propeller fold protein YncE